MLIFIDETGPFVIPASGSRSLCCVGALVVPERTYSALGSAYNQLKVSWTGRNDEIKGRSLNESQVAEVIECLLKHNCLFFVCATEMSLNSSAVMKEYQATQAEFLTADLTDAHHAELKKEVYRLRRIFESTPNQLFIQAVLLTDLVKKVTDQATLHFVMKDPAEAGKFVWVIDGKDKRKMEFEAAWELMAGGLVQSRCMESPSIAYAEGNYSFFQRFLHSNWPGHLPKPIRAPGENIMIINLKKILYESMMFADSTASEGLQLADIITSVFRRALMGRLQRPSYDRLGELMRGLKESPVVLHYFGEPDNKDWHSFSDYRAAISIIESKASLAGS